MGVFKKIDTFKRFRTTSKRESQELIKRDRGALSRIVTWFAELGALSGLTSLSNNVSTFAWGQALGYVSNAGFIFLGTDAIASVEEIARNKAIYSKKKKAATRFIQSLQSEKELDIKTEDGIKAIEYYSNNASKPISFRDRYGIILKQLFVDFKDKKEYDEVRKILKLSGGEQQSVAIARSLSYDPKIILADEPTGNLDKETENDILNIFTNLAKKENKCVIIVTHSKNVCDSVDEVYELKKKSS